jgi:glycosyltransferase involved in cell wall biosynthesis
MKPTLLITNHHLDIIGGGTTVMFYLNAVKGHYDIYADSSVEYYSNSNTPWRFNPGEIKLAPPDMVPDIHLLVSYRGWVPPRGKRNIQLAYFPVAKQIDGWDHIIGLNQFVIDNCRRVWGIDGTVVEAFFDHDSYYIGKKEEIVINVGHYFYESDNHSKNQHMVIAWFKTQPQLKKLICHGTVTSPDYFQALQGMAADDPRIELKYNRPHAEIREDYATARYMVHAIGVGRTDPAQTEHFGIVAVEAMLGGCQPFVHNSGGCRDITGVIPYDEFEDIDLTQAATPEELRAHGLRFTLENTRQQILKAFNG